MNAAPLPWFLLSLLFAGTLLGEEKKPRTDIHGDPLPDGAVARLGSSRLRHGDPVSFVALLPGGKSILTASADWSVRIWDVQTAKEIRRFTHKDGPDNVRRAIVGRGRQMPLSVGLSADGKTLITATQNGRIVRVWDVTTGKESQSFEVRQYFNGVALSSDGKLVAVNSGDGAILLFDTTGKELRRLGPDPKNDGGIRFFGGSGTGMRFSPDGKSLVQVGMEVDNGMVKRAVKVFDTTNGKERYRLNADQQRSLFTSQPTFSPDGKLIVLTDLQTGIHLFDAATGKEIRVIKTAITRLDSTVFTPDGKTLVGRGMMDGAIGLWDMESGKELKVIGKPVGPLAGRPRAATPYGQAASLALSADGKKAVLADGNLVRLIDLANGKDLIATVGHRSPINAIGYSGDGKTLTTQSMDGTIKLWDATGKETGQIRVPETAYTFSLSKDQKTILTQSTDGKLCLVEAATGKELRSFAVAAGPRPVFRYAAATSSPDGKVIALRSPMEPSVRLISAETGKQLALLGKEAEADAALRFYNRSSALAFSDDGKLLATPGTGNNVLIWEVPSGVVHREITLPAANPEMLNRYGTVLRDLAFSRDGRTLAVDLGDNRVLVYEVRTGTERRRYLRKGEPENKAPMPGEARAVIFSSVAMLAGNRSLALSADGRRLAMAGEGRIIHLWDTVTGEEISQLKGHEGDINALSFSPDGKSLASASEDATGLIWDVSALKSTRPLPAKLDEASLGKHWDDLLAADGKRAFAAICSLAAAPEQSAPLLEKNLKPTAAVDESHIAKLIVDLDARRFPTRKKAQEDLEKAGGVAAPALRKALEAKPSEELRKRIEELLEKAKGQSLSPTQLQLVRGIEVLERAGTPAARTVLEKLARGAAGALETMEARAALDRLK